MSISGYAAPVRFAQECTALNVWERADRPSTDRQGKGRDVFIDNWAVTSAHADWVPSWWSTIMQLSCISCTVHRSLSWLLQSCHLNINRMKHSKTESEELFNIATIYVVQSETSLMAADCCPLPLLHKMNNTWGKTHLNILLNTWFDYLSAQSAWFMILQPTLKCGPINHQVRWIKWSSCVATYSISELLSSRKKGET